jgi:hypothetical protein
MNSLGRRRSTQPAPPPVIFEALTQPRRPGARPWLFLRADEREPRVLAADRPHHVLWSSLWPDRADDTIRFGIQSDGGSGSSLEWELLSDGPEPATEVLGHRRYRLNELINRDLRLSFGA